MGYKRKYTKKIKSTVKQNARAIKILKKAPEIKYILAGVEDSSTLVNSVVTLLNAVKRGTEQTERIGNGIKLVGYTIRTCISTNSLTLGGIIRELIFIDTQVNNAVVLPKDEDILNQAASISDALVSTYNIRFVGKGKKYRILHDSGPVQLLPDSRSYYARNHRGRLGYKLVFSQSTNPPVNSDIVNIGVYRMIISNTESLQQSMHSVITFIDT